MNILKIIMLTIALSGCGGGMANSDRPLARAVAEQNAQPHKAIVFGTLESMDEGGISKGVDAFLFGRTSVDAFLTFGGNPDMNAAKYIPSTAKLELYKSANGIPLAWGMLTLRPKQNWVIVQPNTYAILQYRNSANAVADFRGWRRKDRKAYMVLPLGPGEVVYIGHIKARILGQTVSFVVEDRYEELKRTLPIELQAKLQKRLIRAPSLLHAENITHMRKPVTSPIFY